ncbi:hypothetical protein LCGC14_2732480 [marine sediment metagenome]|uniref:Uncharacterized protein n=1 Tax=marine sediment metagenome TaxID=412755 RepID=A0A0F8Z6X0_9ZZZZ
MSRVRSATLYRVAFARARLVCSLRQTFPKLKLREIGEIAGITRERTRQVLHDQGLPTKALYNGSYACIDCGKKAKNKNGRCRACHHKAYYITLTCLGCERTFDRLLSIDKRDRKGNPLKKDFCGNKCQGKWLSANHGFGKHPEHRQFQKKEVKV